MSRGIDHLVLAVRDLDFASAYYKRLGFNLTPRAQHPFGTGNRLAQLGNDFLEIVSVTQPDDIVPFEDGFFSFGAYNQDYLAHRDGMSMIALKSDGWENDRKAFSDAGFDLPAPFTFSRLARQPDSSDVTVGFDLTFVPDTRLPDAVFFTCDHQHQPQFFYKPEFQKHNNGALAVDEVIIACKDIGKARSFFDALYGVENVSENDGMINVVAGGARLNLLPEDLFESRFPNHSPVAISGDAVFAGYRILVSDLLTTRSVLNDNEIEFSDKADSIWLPAFGTLIEFSDQSIGGMTQ